MLGQCTSIIVYEMVAASSCVCSHTFSDVVMHELNAGHIEAVFTAQIRFVDLSPQGDEL